MVAVVVMMMMMMMWWEEEREKRERENMCGGGRGETGIGEDQIRGKRKAETVRNGEGIREEEKRVKCASNEQ